MQANVAGSYGGDMRVRQACFEGNSQLAVIISGEGGSVVARDNFSSDETTNACTNANGRVFVENNDSAGCFTEAGGGDCQGDCIPGADDSDICLAQVIQSNVPSEVPSSSPTTSPPSSSPTTSAPSATPSALPTETASNSPSAAPSETVTNSPSSVPSTSPTTSAPSPFPSFRPTGPPVDYPTPQPVPITPSPSASPSGAPVRPPVTLGPIPFPVEVTLPPFPPQIIPGVTRSPAIARPTIPRVTPPPFSTRRTPAPTRGAPVFQPTRPLPPPTRPNKCPPHYVYVGGKGKGGSKGDDYGPQMIHPNSKYRYECQKMKRKKAKSAKSKITRSKKGNDSGYHGIIGGSGMYGWDPMGGAQGVYRDHSFGGTSASHGGRNRQGQRNLSKDKEQSIYIGPNGELLAEKNENKNEETWWWEEGEYEEETVERWEEGGGDYDWNEDHVHEFWYGEEEGEAEGSTAQDGTPEGIGTEPTDQDETLR